MLNSLPRQLQGYLTEVNCSGNQAIDCCRTCSALLHAYPPSFCFSSLISLSEFVKIVTHKFSSTTQSRGESQGIYNAINHRAENRNFTPRPRCPRTPNTVPRTQVIPQHRVPQFEIDANLDLEVIYSSHTVQVGPTSGRAPIGTDAMTPPMAPVTTSLASMTIFAL